MLKNFATAAVVSAVLAGTSWAFWQDAVPSRSSSNAGSSGRFSGSFPSVGLSPTVTLLGTRQVQTELKLEEDKAKKIDEISATATRERARLAAEYSAKLGELNKKASDDALALLNDTQRRRLEQLRLQQQGLRALTSKAVVEQLGLTQQQRDEIAKLTQPSSSFGRGGDRDRTTNPPNPNVPAAERFRQAVEEANKRAAETREKILAVLTPEQKAKWSEMTGEPFKFPTPQRSVTRGTNIRSSEPAKPGIEKKDQ